MTLLTFHRIISTLPSTAFSNHMLSLIRDNVTFYVLAASRVTFKIETDREQLGIEWSIMQNSITEFSLNQPLQLFVLKWKWRKMSYLYVCARVAKLTRTPPTPSLDLFNRTSTPYQVLFHK